jgi:NDP-sugar pyrophosphorylase family protein
MRPLTYLVPKSMLPIGGKPLLERSIQYLKEWGIHEVILCVAYLKNQIMDYFKDGSSLGIKIHYAQTDMPLGTAGQLKTSNQYISDTFLVMNGDIVTSLNIGNLINFHKNNEGLGTIALKKYEVKIPYGYVTIKNGSRIIKFEEKPSISFLANAGIYVLEPKIFEYIPSDVTVSLETDVFPQLIDKGEQLNSYYEEAYWADVGVISEFERVDGELLSKHFSNSNSNNQHEYHKFLKK